MPEQKIPPPTSTSPQDGTPPGPRPGEGNLAEASPEAANQVEFTDNGLRGTGGAPGFAANTGEAPRE